VYCDTEAENSNDPITTIASDLRTDIDSLKLRVVELQHMLTEHEAQQQAAVIAKQPPIHAQSHTKNSHTGHIHHTDRGEFVRSKSELVIANLLHSLELQYHYEYTIEGCNTGGTMLPDFVFISRNNEIFVWEHLGMLTIPKYRERWSVKRDWYEDNDFVQGINFFVSRDASDGSLDSQMIRKIAMLVKTLL
jgi:hypothetical protein